MVRHHVAQRTGLLIKRGAVLDADGFTDGNLDMVNMIAIPQRLENAVGKP
jgi:hypothetical protein